GPGHQEGQEGLPQGDPVTTKVTTKRYGAPVPATAGRGAPLFLWRRQRKGGAPKSPAFASARSLHHKETLFDQDHVLTLGDLAGGDGFDTGKVIGIGDDHRGGQLIAGGR